MDMDKDLNLPYTYTSQDWNPVTFEGAADPTATPQHAYRGSKTLAEKEAWKFVEEKKPQFDLVALCPAMVFGPQANAPKSIQDVSESNRLLWKVASGGPSEPLPPCPFNFWIDVRDLAEIHVQALLNEACGGKRYVPVAPELFTHQMTSEIMSAEFPSLKGKIVSGIQEARPHIKVDLEPVEKDFPGFKFRTYKEMVVDFTNQIASIV